MEDIELGDGEALEELFGGKKIIQNRNLYRFTSDSVMLSKFVRGGPRDVVADFCSGCGIVGFHFLCLNPSIKSLTLFEMQNALSSMAERTKKLDGFDKATVVTTRLQDIGPEYNETFSIILCNPPYETEGFENVPPSLAACRFETTITLKEISDVAFSKLRCGGKLVIMNRARRLAELMYTLKGSGLEPKRLQFISGGGKDERPYLVMCEAVKGGGAGIEILPTKKNDGTSRG
ncbi:MAG: methyltransferase [Clostridia bacterium]|nr:methyltransferase [Clostridia bacterium]